IAGGFVKNDSKVTGIELDEVSSSPAARVIIPTESKNSTPKTSVRQHTATTIFIKGSPTIKPSLHFILVDGQKLRVEARKRERLNGFAGRKRETWGHPRGFRLLRGCPEQAATYNL